LTAASWIHTANVRQKVQEGLLTLTIRYPNQDTLL